MANITGCSVPGAQLQLMDVDTGSSAADELDKLLEKAKDEQPLVLPTAMICVPPQPGRAPEGKVLVLKGGHEEPSQFVVHRRGDAEGDCLPAVAERKPLTLAAGARITPQPQPEYQYAAAAPSAQHDVAPSPPHHRVPLSVNPLPLISATVHQLQADEPRRDNPQGVPLVKSGNDAPVRLYEPPPTPRHVKQEFATALPAVMPAAKPEGEGQSRISYAFRSWGNEHRVELTSLRRDHQPLTVVLTPSDNLVNRRLQEAIGGQPLDLNLVLQDDGRGDQQRRQRGDNTPEAEDEV